jgi:aryl-alcohol dehydrogenase-like predicted oxidoreductase
MAPYFALAARLGMSAATLALAWVNDRWFVGSNIIGATTMEQLKEDIASAATTLPADAIAEIERIHSTCLEPAQ